MLFFLRTLILNKVNLILILKKIILKKVTVYIIKNKKRIIRIMIKFQ